MTDLKKILFNTISEAKNEIELEKQKKMQEQINRIKEEKEASKKRFLEYKEIFSTKPELIFDYVKDAIKRDKDYFIIEDGYPNLGEYVFHDWKNFVLAFREVFGGVLKITEQERVDSYYPGESAKSVQYMQKYIEVRW